jgi:toxin FitB
MDGYTVKFLVDANILSEPTKSEPNPGVVGWLHANLRELAVDPIILGEVRFGIYLLPNGSRKRRLEHWFVHGVEAVRCLPWTESVGLRWAKLLADLRTGGKAMPIKDSMIAATALVHGLTVATRNKRDFAHAGVRALNPFEEN